MSDATRTHPPDSRPDEAPGEERVTDLAAWAPPPSVALSRPTPPLEMPLPVLVRVQQALHAPEAERPEAATQLNEALARMAEGGGGREVADTLQRLLASGQLTGLVDAQGRSCRAVAVEALLSLGFPYALEVDPDDLKHLRANVGLTPARARSLLDFGPGVPATVLASGVLAQLLEELLRPHPPGAPVTLQVGLAVLAMVALWLAPPRTPVYRVGLTLLALGSGYGLLMALESVGESGGLWVGVAGMVAALLAALRKG
ncbi:hypothetical protein LY474_16675 [Myxococcus stipitatus]|uniref:hypothetical protein n=1 Tax=Myxococcus stipitatus TaxID=83455 RepID=UPI001F302A59|nr:hypothetical protein [Myxococcus stipitatus]MCE9669447.1 hypothetical protein [Myxococcus stipitatus]